ncbi:MAG TPA: ATP-binding protein [Vicinamibacterales bacterium]|jgi:signal transduction histidine kinase
MMMRSLRGRLLASVIGGMAVLLIAFAALVFEVMERSLREGFDAALAATLHTVNGAIEQDARGIRVDVDERDLPEFRRPRNPDYFEVWRNTGEVLARSSSLGELSLDRPDAPADGVVVRRIRLPNGRRGRAATARLVPRTDDEGARLTSPRHVIVVVARDSAPLDDQMSALKWLLGLGTGGTIALSLLLAGLIVRRGLGPLDELAAQIASIGENDLSARIALDAPPSELSPVVQRLNGLLQRLDEAFARERAFTADAAHELRTPLAGLRATVEVALARPREQAEYRESLSECLAILQHTETLVDRLLALTRMEGRQTPIAADTVSVAELVETAWRPLAQSIEARHLVVSNRVPAGAACTGDRGILLMALTALAANAAEYTNDGGRIDIETVTLPEQVTLTVSNTGCRLSSNDVSHVFERFWRGDPARGDTGRHCGLGLTLVQQAVGAIGGTVTASVVDGVFCVQLTLPFASPGGVVS